MPFRFFLTVFMVAAAAGAEAAPLSEGEAVARALERYPSIAAARAAIVAAEGIAREAEFLLPDNPVVGVEYGTAARADQNDAPRDWTISVSVPVWIAGQRGARQAYATAKRHEAELDVETAKWALAGAVREAYWRVWEAHALARAASLRAQRSAALAATAERQAKVKEIAALDASQVRVEALADSRAEAKAAGAYEQAVAALAELVGESAAELAEPQPASPPVAAPEQALAERPDLRSLRQKAEVARANLGLQDRLAWPNPELSLAFSRKREDPAAGYDNSVVLGMSMPIPVVARNQRERLAAAAEIGRSEAEYQQTARQAAREVDQAGAAWRSAWTQWRQARQALDLAEDNLRLIERSFQIGEIAALDLIQEKRRWAEELEAEREALAALAAAKAAWEQARGILPAAASR